MKHLLIFANHCSDNLLGIFPPWHKGLTVTHDRDNPSACNVSFEGLNDIWVVVLNVIEILLRLGGVAAIGFIIWGGAQMVMSQGDPERVSNARDTILNAVIGLVIVIFANVIISFVTNAFI